MLRSNWLKKNSYYSLLNPDCTKEEFLKIYDYISEELFLVLKEGHVIHPNSALGGYAICRSKNAVSFNRRAVDWQRTKKEGKRCYFENFADGNRIILKTKYKMFFSRSIDYYTVFKLKYKKIISDLAKAGEYRKYIDVSESREPVDFMVYYSNSPDRRTREIFEKAGNLIGKDFSFVYKLVRALGKVLRSKMLDGEYVSMDYLCFRIKPNNTTLRFEVCDEKFCKDITLKNMNPMNLKYGDRFKTIKYKSQAIRSICHEIKKFIKSKDYGNKTLFNYMKWQYNNTNLYPEVSVDMHGSDLTDILQDTNKWARLVSSLLHRVHHEEVPVEVIESIINNIVSK